MQEAPASIARQGAVGGLGWLLWPRRRSLVNAPRTRAGRSIVRLVFFAVLGILFMWGTFRGSRWLFLQFLQVEFLADLLIRRTLDIVLLFFTGLLVFSNVITAFSTYFLADDLPLLVSSPIPVARLYLARLTDNWMQASWMMLVFALPIMAGCGPALNAPWWFYPALPILVFPLTVICSVVGTAITLVLARILPAGRTHDVLVVLAVIGFLVLYIAFRLAEPERYLDPEGFDSLVTLIGNLKEPSAPISPSDWVVLTLFKLMSPDPGQAALPAVVLGLGAVAACALGAFLAEGLYLRAFSLSQEGRRGADGERSESMIGRLLAPLRRPPTVPRGPLSALVGRDARIFFRTTSQWTQLLLIGALVIVYIYNFKHFRTLQTTGLIGPTGLFFLNVLLAGFVITTIAARFLYPSVSLEGRAFWAIQAAPIDTRTLLRAKVRWGLWPLLVVGELLAVGSAVLIDAPPALAVSQAVVVGLMCYALTGLGVGMGAADPQFHEDNPARIAGSVGGVVFMLTGLAYLVVLVVLLARPIWLLTTLVDRPQFRPETGLVLRYGLQTAGAVVMSVVAHVVAVRLGARKLEQAE